MKLRLEKSTTICINSAQSQYLIHFEKAVIFHIN